MVPSNVFLLYFVKMIKYVARIDTLKEALKSVILNPTSRLQTKNFIYFS